MSGAGLCGVSQYQCTSSGGSPSKAHNPFQGHNPAGTLVAFIHFCPFTDESFTHLLLIHGVLPRQEGSFCPFTHSVGNHRRMLHSIHAIPFTPITRTVATKVGTNEQHCLWRGRWGNSERGNNPENFSAHFSTFYPSDQEILL